MTMEVRKRLFTVDEYHQIGAAGILADDDRVELIDGEIVEMSPIGRRHAACVDRLTRLFVSGVEDAAIVRIQNPVALSDHSEPQPDAALLRPRDDFYASAHPSPNDIWLIVEVAESSANFDRQVKLPQYAAAGIPEVWLVDLSSGTIEVYCQPTDQDYAQVETFSRGDHLAPIHFPQLELWANDILG